MSLFFVDIYFFFRNPTSDQKYEKMLSQLQEVVKFKESGGKCERQYTCNNHDSENII